MAEERSDVTDGTEALETRAADAADTVAGAEDENTERIKQEIERTRDEMGDTIDEIQDRLSFSNLTDQVTEQVNHAVDTAKVALYHATIGKAVNIMKDVTSGKSGGAVLSTVKSNPVPFALIGAGAGLLAVKAYRGNGGNSGSQKNGGRKALSAGTSSSADIQGSQGGNSSSKLGKVTGAVSGTVGTAYEKVSDLGGTALDTTSQQVQNNPLIAGAVALAVGAVVGLAIPSTRYEGELMGETRDQLMERAQTAASGLVDQAQTVATDLVDQAKGAVSEAVNNSTEGSGSGETSSGASA